MITEKVTPKQLLEFYLFNNDLGLNENNSDLIKLCESCFTQEKKYLEELNIDECFYLILDGSFIVIFKTDKAVKIRRTIIKGSETTVFAFRSRKHEIIGDFVLGTKKSTFKLITTIIMSLLPNEQPSKVIKIPRNAFEDFASNHPLIYRNMYFLTMAKLISSREYCESIQLRSSTEGSACLASILLYLSRELGINEERNINGIIKKDFLKAFMSEQDDKTIYSKLDYFKEKKLIDYSFDKQNKFIKILDSHGLEILTQQN